MLTNTDVTQIKAERARRNYYYFFKEFWDEVVVDPMIDSPHIKYLCDEMQIVGGWIINRQPKEYDLLINIPPGASKSTICSILFPVWLWINDPTIRIIGTSYSNDASMPHALKSRDCMRSNKFRQWYGGLFDFKHDNDNKKPYENTKGGQRITTSSQGTVTSKHAHVIINDDPHKVPDPQKGESGATIVDMEKDNRWFFQTLSTRKVDKLNTPTIIIMQRVHEKDLSGQLIKKAEDGMRLKHICLPITDDYEVIPNELRSIYSGGYLDPVRMGAKVLQQEKINLGSYGYAGQYGQKPAPPEGGILKSSWFKYFTMGMLPTQHVVNFYCDTAYTSKAKNDPTAIMAYTKYKNNLYILKVAVKRLEFPELCKFITSWCPSVGYSSSSRIYIEPKASGKSVAQQLRSETSLSIIEAPAPVDDKVTRIHSQSPKIEAGRVFILQDEDWVDNFVGECTQFPNGPHDDQVDCLEAICRIELSYGFGDLSMFG